jgi:hypothetical protein
MKRLIVFSFAIAAVAFASSYNVRKYAYPLYDAGIISNEPAWDAGLYASAADQRGMFDLCTRLYDGGLPETIGNVVIVKRYPPGNPPGNHTVSSSTGWQVTGLLQIGQLLDAGLPTQPAGINMATACAVAGGVFYSPEQYASRKDAWTAVPSTTYTGVTWTGATPYATTLTAVGPLQGQTQLEDGAYCWVPTVPTAVQGACNANGVSHFRGVMLPRYEAIDP